MTAPTPARRLYRVTDARVAAGVAAGIAAHLNASVTLVRIAFVVLASFNGLGAVLYAAFWAVLPVAPGQRRKAGRNRRQLVPFLALGLGILLVQVLSGTGAKSVIGWLVAVVAVGVGIIWRQSDPKRRERWTATVPQAPWLGVVLEEGDRRAFILRLVGGGALVVVGIVGTVAVVSGSDLAALVNGLLFAGLALAGVGLALAPLLWRVFGQLRTEREARIREQERAEVAAMIHDQVLHTLALIQRRAEDPKSVLRLARAQERTLRGWLYKSTASPAERFSAALEEAAAEVEDTYAIAVEVVVVGDRDVDDRVRALVAAAREALVNAGKHAKVSTVSLYAEVEPDQCSAFVRDRGVGFDLEAVDDDRHGVRGSILGRMKRHGGRAEIRSEPGSGTEVRLFMPTPGWSPAEEKEKVSE
ncbi:PspC domain-containing protein [Planosporangium thailandense]|uniref:PspC domain-containing protein n=1 Tax=Planosporangium thailandense TaxID=765197 RepID=A0ABX0XVY8_9ACTN|nr:ATP-binding protein [Planosporangium thailandense]NJC70206.1 PspC domain-containing protein [Planosporangium thailandense]